MCWSSFSICLRMHFLLKNLWNVNSEPVLFLEGVGWETYMQLYQEHIFLHILIGTLYGSS